MFIDVHAHAYRRPTPFVAAFPTVEQVIARYDAVGIEKGMLLPVVSPEIYLPQLEHTLQRFPDLVILGHGLTFWSEIGRLDTPAQRKTTFRPDGAQVGYQPPAGPIKEEGVMPKLMRRYPNLYGELSDASVALARDPEYGPRFLDEFQDRILFGTDYCSVTMPSPSLELLLRWRDAGRIGESVFNKITRGNAIRLFRL